jgi:hypothetical protein
MADWVDRYHDYVRVFLNGKELSMGARAPSMLMTKALWEDCVAYSRDFCAHVDKEASDGGVSSRESIQCDEGQRAGEVGRDGDRVDTEQQTAEHRGYRGTAVIRQGVPLSQYYVVHDGKRTKE